MRILFVDDNPDLRALIPMLLAKRGYLVQTAATAGEALVCACDTVPDVVLSDISMPEMDGYDFMAALRAQSDQPFCSVALTGFGGPSDFSRAREAGFDECLTKPIDFEKLFNILDRLQQTLVVDGQN